MGPILQINYIQIYVYGKFEKFPENNKAVFGLVIQYTL